MRCNSLVQASLIAIIGLTLIAFGCGTVPDDDTSSAKAIPLELLVPSCDDVDEPTPFPEQNFNCVQQASDPKTARK